MISHDVIPSDRLDLIIFTSGLINAFEADDRAFAEGESGASFPVPFAPPPETDDVLEVFRMMIMQDQSSGLFLPRLIINRAERAVLGSVGVNAPDAHGVAMMGYSVYPLFEGNGYASEAAMAIADYVLVHADIRALRATIEVSNRASQKVASRAGLINTNENVEAEGMVLSIWERKRDQS